MAHADPGSLGWTRKPAGTGTGETGTNVGMSIRQASARGACGVTGRGGGRTGRVAGSGHAAAGRQGQHRDGGSRGEDAGAAEVHSCETSSAVPPFRGGCHVLITLIGVDTRY